MAIVEVSVEGRVATVTMNRPETMNAVNSELLQALLSKFRALSARDDLGAVILTGVGKSFAAGADIAEMKDYGPVQARNFSRLGQAVTRAIEDCPLPVIAAVNGYAFGGGCELAMCCDVRYCSENARFGQLEINLGIMPGWGGTQRLVRLCGPAFAKDLLYTGRIADAGEALRWGLVNAVFPKDELAAKAQEFAGVIASKSTPILANIKMAANRALEEDLTGGLELEADLFGLCFATEDQTEGMDAFLNKRQPDFKHR